MHVVAILLAAGSSRRFGGEKLLAPHRGRPLIEHALAALTSSPGVDTTIVVVHPRFPLPPERPRCRFVINPEHEEGMGSSLRAGVRAAPAETDAYLVALADMPAIGPELIASLIACYRTAGKGIVVPMYQGRRGHPVMISGELREALLGITGDVGARELIRQHPEWAGEFETGDGAVVYDVDAPADLEAGG
jgi:CTP:molybdopterin cytidylyltransferase MocA